MKKGRVFVFIIILTTSLQVTAQSTASPQVSTPMTGQDLVRMLRGGYANYSRALDYIGNIYGKNFNNGITPERPTLIALAEIVEDYMFTPNRKWDVPAEALVISALKEVAQNPSILQLARMLKGSSDDFLQAEDYIGNIYAKNFNNGITPERPTLIALAEIVEDYMFTPNKKWDVPAEALVINALKEVAQDPSILQKRMEFTGNKLASMLRGSSDDFLQAEDYIGKVFIKNFNISISLKELPRVYLATLTEGYLSNHNRKLDLPAEALVTEALKDVPAQIEAQKIYWANAYKAAEAYFSLPSSENAEKLCMALPDKRIPILVDGGEGLQNLIFDMFARVLRLSDPPPPNIGKNFSIIERGMDQGEPNAVDIMFRLINLSDGAITEIICFDLGELISKHPRLFLQKLRIHEANLQKEKHLGCILGMAAYIGEIPEAGNDEAKYKEIYNSRIARRIKALESVDDPGLKEIRDRCLEILKK